MAVTNYYTMAGELCGQRTGDKSAVRYLPDALGSVTMADFGSKTTSATYTPYGVGTGPDTTYGWVGAKGYRPSQLTIASHYVRARHYTASQGSWSSVDPLWPSERAYAYVAGRPTVWTDATGMNGKPPGSSGGDGPPNKFPKPEPPDKKCDFQHCGDIDTTRSTTLWNEQTRPGQEFTVSAAPFGVGLSWKATSRVVTHDAVWTITRYICKCVYGCGYQMAWWDVLYICHCKGTHLKEDIRVGTTTLIIREEYHSSGSQCCPKLDVVQSFVGSLACKVCKLLDWPDWVCAKLCGGK
jgi:RHS repeat-associated protein